MRRATTAATCVLATVALWGCGDDRSSPAAASSTVVTGPSLPVLSAPVIDPGDGGRYAPVIDPGNFVDVVDNPYFPLTPGSRWEYAAIEGGEAQHNTVVVTGDRRTVMGVSTTVVRDTVTVGGEMVEDTYDWYAQDRDGNVWYFGEAVRNFDQGRFENADGSFEAGVGGALPGMIMPAHPSVGDAYRQEYSRGEAEDMGEILRVAEHTDVPFGSFDDVLVTRDWNPLEPDVIEEKHYAPGVGVIFETTVAGGDETSQLVAFTAGT